MPTISELTQLIGNALMLTFGHPFLAGACLLAIIFATLYKAGVPADAAVVVSVPLLIALGGIFMPNWILPFIAIGIGTILALMFIKLVGW